MDPAWQQYRWAAAQTVPTNRLGIPQALLEQAASVSALSPPLTTSSQSVHAMPSVSLPSLHAHPTLDTSGLPGLQSAVTAENLAKLPPLSTIQTAGSGAMETQSWNLANWLKRDSGGELVEPPPAHTGQRATSAQQNPYRPQAATQAEQNLLMDHFELLRQQLQQLQDPPKGGLGTAAASALKYPAESQPSALQAQLYHQEAGQRDPKYSEQIDYQDSICKYQPPVQKYQEPVTETKYKRDTDYTKRLDSQSRYSEVPHAHTKQVSQVRGYSGYTENSPSSHNSSPQVPQSSPNVAYTSTAITQQAYANFSQPVVSNNYRPTTTEATYDTATSMYEAVSPPGQSLPGYSSGSIQDRQQVHHASSPAINPHQTAYAHVQSDSTSQQSTQIVQAQADSTTKPKKGRGSKSGARTGGTRTAKKKKSQEADLQTETQTAEASLQQHMQQQLIQQQQQQGVAMHAGGQHAMLTAAAMPGLDGTTLHIPAVAMQHAGLEGLQPLYELPAAAQYSEDMLTQVHMAHELLGINHQDVIRSEEQAPVFIANQMGQGFESPVQSVDDMGKATPTVEDNLGLGFSTLDYRKVKQKTKAEQKEMPQSLVSRELDDEFGHLSRDPELAIKTEAAVKASQGVGGALGMGNPLSGQTPMVSQPEIKPPPNIVKKESSFQTSFLSFIQGNKQETLSSVTNSAIVKKPELPKYIPEPPRPKPKPKPPEPPKKVEPKVVVSPKKAASNNVRLKSDAMTFSDDEELSPQVKTSVSKVVQGAISHLDEKNQGTSTKIIKKTAIEQPTFATQSAPLKLKIKMSNITMPTSVEKERSKSKRKSSSGSKSRRKSGGKSRISDDEYEVVNLEVESGEEASRKLPSPTPVRQRSTRKAKEKTEEKRRRRQEKKEKKKRASIGEEEDFVLSSDGGIIESGSEKEYDSDKDPGWQPTVDDFMGGGGISMAEVGIEKKQRARSFHKPGRPRSSKTKRKYSCSDDELDYESGEEPLVPVKKNKAQASLVRPLVADCDSDDNSPHQYNKGDFVMEKKELCHPDKFVIWKIDAGKLIQKYEPSLLEDGTLIHKSLSTYSSWSDYLKPNYLGVETEVIRIQGKSQEMVRVLDKYRPVPSDESLEKHPYMESFNVFVQILISEALEPGFLTLIHNPGDFDYYLGPLKDIECKLQTKETAIYDTVKWQPKFKECVDKFPLLRITEKYAGTGVTCQASEAGSSEPSEKEAKLYGEVYDRSTLNKDTTQPSVNVEDAETFGIGVTAGEHLRRYHRLHHFKCRMHKKCLYMVECCKRGGSKETSDILDQCLQNRIWVQLLFREYIKLLDETPEANGDVSRVEENAAETSQSTPPPCDS